MARKTRQLTITHMPTRDGHHTKCGIDLDTEPLRKLNPSKADAQGIPWVICPLCEAAEIVDSLHITFPEYHQPTFKGME